MCHYRWGSGRQHGCEEQVLISLALTERHRPPVTFWLLPDTHLQNLDTEQHWYTAPADGDLPRDTQCHTGREHARPHRPERDPPRLRGHLRELWLLITEFHGKDTSWCRELAWVWEALCLPLLPQTPCKHTLCDTVSFMCQLSWAVGCPGYLVKFYSGCFCEGGFG